MSDLIGHDAAVAAFDAALASGNLHHAWLLAGPRGVGKARFAAQAALALIGGGERERVMIAECRHPDVLMLTREVWDKGRPPAIVPAEDRSPDDVPARSIRVAQIRSLRDRLTRRPTLAPRRAILVDAADDMEGEAANALLKVLEEPPADTVFLLVGHAPGRLLPTVRSRCRVLRFDALGVADAAAVLRRELPDEPEAEIAALVRAGDGSPGAALRFAGLDVADLDRRLAEMLAAGDPGNAGRAALADALSAKAAGPRYEAFLARAVTALARAARDRTGEPLRRTLDLHDRARTLAAVALGQSLDPRGVAFEMAGLVAAASAGGGGAAPLPRPRAMA